MKSLFIFDFDDTLLDSAAEVRVTHEDGTTSSMSSEKYAKYEEKPGDTFDFSDFDAYPQNAEIIEPVFAELRSAIALSGPQNVIILTARSNSSPVELFLKNSNVPAIEVVAVGSANPMAKASFVLDKVKDDAYDEVVLFEDNVKNIRTIRKVLRDGTVRLTTNRVSNGRIVDVQTESILKTLLSRNWKFS